MPEITMDDLVKEIPSLKEFDDAILYQSELDIKYAGYVERQRRQAEKLNKMEKIIIPQDFNYDEVLGLSTESKEKLKSIKPHSVGQAVGISGVRNSDIAILMVILQRGKNNGSEAVS